MLKLLENKIKRLKNLEKAKILQRFFKTKKGEYGEGDIFFGITVPDQRKIAKEFLSLSLDEIQILLDSKIHEKRLIALLILIEKFKKSEEQEKEQIVKFYLNNTKNIDNWDLVDLSASKIIGFYLLNKDRGILYQLAKSKNLWEKRIAIISTFAFIQDNKFEDTIKISELLLKDNHDLIHKATGWMLREVGKKDKQVLINFLNKHSKIMPRTMLRYSIERLNEKERKFYLER